MNRSLACLLLLAQCLCGVGLGNTAEFFPSLLFAAEGFGKILRYDSEGKVAWEYHAPMARDAWTLQNGNVLFCFNRDYDSAKHDNPSGVLEVTPDKQVVFSFSTTGQVWSCQRMMDGNTLVGASSQGRLLVVNRKAEVIQSVRLLSPPGHSCLRNARQLGNGHFLVAEESDRAAREYNSHGKLVREIKLAFAPYSVIRLENGNTVICGQQSAVEVDPADKTVWSVKGSEFPELGVRWFAGLQILPNGNRFFCNAGGKVPFLEMTLDKRILWQSPGTVSIPLGHGIQRLDALGIPQK